MTEAELDRLEAHWGKVHSCDCPMCPFDSEDARELLAEVRRLREAVELAYQEGWMHGHIHGKTEVKLAAPPAMYDDYDTSNAKRDLEAQ